MRMHHVGVVLPTVEQAEHLIDLLGLEVDYRGYVKSYHADLIFTKYGPMMESPIEFIIPHEGVLTKFNNGKGGIAHIAFEVEDVEAASQELRGKGLEMLEPEAVEGTSDIIVNFLRPRYSEGILIELVQTVAPIDRGAEANKSR
ncbi:MULTISPECIES: VOC family protein [Eubacteriales]|uniref:VOC family protein n=1 Tax=Eubacteriales TaxID=186802 RepID=UPI00026F29C0|nr:VOC family protein [Clostridium sp. MSTE9]EJF40695.1 putative methylmalonyl-CoA epimerase [Clostridium sp. MSTE9]